MEPVRINTNQAILILTIIGIVIGFILGLVPLIYGRFKGKARLGVIGFVVSMISGAIWSILPLFVMLFFVFLIIRNEKPKQPIELPENKQDND